MDRLEFSSPLRVNVVVIVIARAKYALWILPILLAYLVPLKKAVALKAHLAEREVMVHG